MGEIYILLEDLIFNSRYYKKGSRFKVIGQDNIRGFDLEDQNGNKIYETRFIANKFMSIKDIREDKLRKLGIL